MDDWSSFAIFSLVVVSILTLVSTQQILITQVHSKHRRIFLIRWLTLSFLGTEAVYLLLCLLESQNATRSLSESRFVFELVRYFLLSICVLIFALDRLQSLYRTHLSTAMPLWIRTTLVTLCVVFNLTLLITFSMSMYSRSAFYWQLQLIQLKFAVVGACALSVTALCHIYLHFNRKIHGYLHTIVSQQNQLQQIEVINRKFLQPKTHSKKHNKLKTQQLQAQPPQAQAQLTKQDVLATNLSLAQKIREANYKLYAYIALVFACLLVELVYIPIVIRRVVTQQQHVKGDPTLSYLTPPHELASSSLEWCLQRALFAVVGVVLIHYTFERRSLFTLLTDESHPRRRRQLCIVLCCNCSLLWMLMRELYLRLLHCMRVFCPCCVCQPCVFLQQHIYEVKKYHSYFGHAPPLATVAMDGVHKPTELKVSSRRHSHSRNQSRDIFDSPPLVLNNAIAMDAAGAGAAGQGVSMSKQQRHERRRRASHASICGIEIATADDNSITSGDLGGANHNTHPQLKYGRYGMDDDDDDENGIQLSDSDVDVRSLDNDSNVPQQIIDEDAAKHDLVDFDDNKSEQYDNFAEIMIERELSFGAHSHPSQTNLLLNLHGALDEFNLTQPPKHGKPKTRRQSVELGLDTGSIGTLGKKRRGSLILATMDSIKQGIKHIKEKQQHKKESHQEQQFIQESVHKNFAENALLENEDTDLTNGTSDSVAVDVDNETSTSSGDDELEYYNHNKTQVQKIQQPQRTHQRSKDRLSALRNSLKSMIPTAKRKTKNESKNEYSHRYNAVSINDECSLTFNDRNDYQPFEYATDTMVVHVDKDDDADGLRVPAELTTDTDDDNISLATYGTAQDCLDDDLESELHAMAMNHQLVLDASPNKNKRRRKSTNIEHVRGGGDERDERDKSVSLSLKSVSDDDDSEEEAEDERSLPAPTIVKRGKLQNHMLSMRASASSHGHSRKHSNLTALTQIQEMEGGAMSDDFGVTMETNAHDSDGHTMHTVDSSADDLDVTVNLDDMSVGDGSDVMTASML